MTQLKIGIIGAGGIANTVAPTLQQLPEIECYAVGSRTLDKAEAFAQKNGFQKAYGSYEELLEDPEVELVYICTPHICHYDCIIQSLNHGKHVLCEKPFTINATLAEKAMRLAREKKLYLAEAMWISYMPSRKIIQEFLESGEIGEIRMMTANLSHPMRTVPRLLDIQLAGGALLDVGVYGLNFALTYFGSELRHIDSSVSMTQEGPHGVDGMESITLHYADGRVAVLTHSLYGRGDRKGIFHGENGYIIVENINNPRSITMYDTKDQVMRHMDMPPQISGYEYEFQEAVRCIREGRTEPYSLPHQLTLDVEKVSDMVRKQCGLRYPGE